MPRSPLGPFFLASIVSFTTLALPATAAGATPSAAPLGADYAVPARNAGTIEGRVASIDYKSGVMSVDVPQGGSKKTYDVLVVPGTNIQGNKTFHTIADLKKGARVQVLLSQHGATYTAQIIRLL
jgi:hypothetical protein